MKLAGMAMGAFGALYLLLHRGEASFGSSLTGDLFVLINASSFAIYLVLVKPLMRKYSAVTVMAWSFLLGLVMVTPFGLGDVMDLDLSTWTAGTVASVLFVVVGVTFVAYLLNTWALRHVDPGVVGTYIYLQPLLAVLFGWVHARMGSAAVDVPGPAVGSVHIISAAAIFMGVHLVNRSDAVGR
jgi:drug/metabolite transporter (DMT)-like permease